MSRDTIATLRKVGSLYIMLIPGSLGYIFVATASLSEATSVI